ncbi:hypothetical protein GCM10020358_15590 [Amorphoplanes nipponensis]|uniref:YcxB-like C-terminal domain-containing protein n=1 Tax=Actinoplanes nipponensis TaxID=135950 RepID=A0A919JM55_9ACTN|nr:YcxB family protein [Actinoplanes nipponensis]GIE53323.1 hypothetical protein Ani05nite_68570 [Actinoplanes nipponensis]
MPLSFAAEPDERLLGAAVRHVSRQRFMVLRVAGLLLGAVGSLCWLVLDGSRSYLVLGLTLAIALFFGVVLVELAARQATRMSVKRVSRPTTYRFGPAGVGVGTELVRTEMSWAAIRSTEELPGQVILALAGGGFVPVPVGGLTGEQLAELRALLSGNVGRPAAAPPPVPPPVPASGPAADRPGPPGVRPPTP